MEIIDKDNHKGTWKLNETVSNELFKTIETWKWEELKKLLRWYFSMVEHFKETDYLINNLDYYDETLSKLIEFSETPFMEETIRRVSDNGQFEEHCWAHLRNLLSPFKTIIDLVNDVSKGKIKEEFFKSFIKEFKWNFEDNKKAFSDLCNFLEKDYK